MRDLDDIMEQQIARMKARQRERQIAADREHRDRRERIATAALQGLLADSSGHASIASYVADAVALADALIAELDKKEDGT